MHIGIDLGGTNIAIGLVDNNGMIIYKDSVATLPERNYQEIINDMVKLSLKVVEQAGYKINMVQSIGIGCPGTPDNEKGLIVYANNFKDFYDIPIREEIQKSINLPVYIENDANCAALAESISGITKGVNHSITITLGTGVGGGVIINNRIYSGFNYAASELGHILLIMDGEPCTCGRNGCWEVYASAGALVKQTKRAVEKNPQSLINAIVNNDIDNINGKTAFDAARQGDKVAKEIVSKYIKYIAEGLISVINAFQPEIIAIGGGISKEGDYLLNPLKDIVDKNIYTRKVPQTQIKIAKLGNDAGIIGAAMLGKTANIK